VKIINISATMVNARIEEGDGGYQNLNRTKKTEGQLSARKRICPPGPNKEATPSFCLSGVQMRSEKSAKFICGMFPDLHISKKNSTSLTRAAMFWEMLDGGSPGAGKRLLAGSQPLAGLDPPPPGGLG